MDSVEKWKLFVAGDNAAYAWIYTTYIQDLYRFALCFTSDTELVKDCIQDLFTYIYSNRKKISCPQSIKSYLLISLKHNLIHAISSNKLLFENVTEENYDFLQEQTVEDIFINKETSNEQVLLVKKMLSVLSSRQKEAIYYRYIQELSLTEISEIMNMNYQSTKNLIKRGLDKIRTIFPNSDLIVLLILFRFFYTI